MGQAENVIKEMFGKARNPALWLSFGKDSLLLLHLVRELGYHPTLIWYRDWIPPQAARVIKEWDLTVFSYAPACRYKVGESVVSEYSVGPARFPVIADVSADGHSVGQMVTPYFHYDYDYTLFGYKAADTHPLITTTFAREIQLGPTRVIAPLYDMTDDDVLDAIATRAIPYEPYNDDVLDCDLPVVALPDFRQRFNL